jgi:hypothetical protein
MTPFVVASKYAGQSKFRGALAKFLRVPAVAIFVFMLEMSLSGCGAEAPKPAEQATGKPAEPAIPQEMQDAAIKLLGSDGRVLLYGDLAKNGKDQVLVINALPNTPKSTVAGTVVTRAVIAEKEKDHWEELFRCDEYLKNPRGFLGMTPVQAVSGWKLQHENSPETGMTLYFTPIKAGEAEKTLPICVKWNPATKRYQSMDRSYQKFLLESPSLEAPRSLAK